MLRLLMHAAAGTHDESEEAGTEPIKNPTDFASPPAIITTAADKPEDVGGTHENVHEALSGANASQLPSPTTAVEEVSQPIKELAETTAPAKIFTASVEDNVVTTKSSEEDEEAPLTAVEPTATEDSSLPVEAVKDAASTAPEGVAVAPPGVSDEEDIPKSEEATKELIPTAPTKSVEATAATGRLSSDASPPSLLNALASNFASDVGLALKHITGVDPINAEQVNAVLPLESSFGLISC